jgi:hypothetical protein
VIPEIDIWRTAQLMLKRYGDKALEESAARVDELVAAGDDTGWLCGAGSLPPPPTRNTTPPGRVTDHFGNRSASP